MSWTITDALRERDRLDINDAEAAADLYRRVKRAGLLGRGFVSILLRMQDDPSRLIALINAIDREG